MRQLILFGSFLFFASTFTACKKEIIRMNDSNEYPTESVDAYTSRAQSTSQTGKSDSTVVVGPVGDKGGGITDPNDDDYSKKRPARIKN